MAKEANSIIPKRGEIYLVCFDPALGSEIKKTRPALILQNNIANCYSPITIVAAITSQAGGKTYPTEVEIRFSGGVLRSSSTVLLNQIRTIDKRRLIKRLGALNKEVMSKIDRALLISLGVIKI